MDASQMQNMMSIMQAIHAQLPTEQLNPDFDKDKIIFQLTTKYTEKLCQYKTSSAVTAHQAFVNYFKLSKMLAYGQMVYPQVVQQIQQQFGSVGVCAKVLKAGDVAWKCEDCELDPTCIMCQECFQKSDHTGHRVWLKQNVSGCCDCGDPDAFKPEAFCSDHKGFSEMSDGMLEKLPTHIRDCAPIVFSTISKQLRTLCLEITNMKNDQSSQTALTSNHDLIFEIIQFFEGCIKECAVNTIFISKAMMQIEIEEYMEENSLQQDQDQSAEDGIQSGKHKCSHRHFINESQEAEFYEKLQKFVMSQTELLPYCTCSPIDLLFQTGHRFGSESQNRLSDFFTSLFQSLDVKQHLGLSYVSNYQYLTKGEDGTTKLESIGVQLVTIDSIVLMIMKDPILRKNLINCYAETMDSLIQDPLNDQLYYRFIQSFYNIKYMAKPATIPYIIKETDFIQQIFQIFGRMYFADAIEKRTEMPEMDNNSRIKYTLLETELKAYKVLKKYLTRVDYRDIPTCKSMIQGFTQQFDTIYADFLANHQGKGFYTLPLHKLFGYFFSRLIMFNVLDEQNQNLQAKPDFEGILKKYCDNKQIQSIQNMIHILFIQQGFVHEVKSKKWIYYDQSYQMLSHIYYQTYEETFLNDTALMQLYICTSPKSTDIPEMFVKSFGTDIWLLSLVVMINQNSISLQNLSENLTKFDARKMSELLKNLLRRIIQICIIETSFIAPLLKDSQKPCDNSQTKSPRKLQQDQKIKEIYKGHLQREVLQNLFLHGGSTTIDKIKKAANGLFLKTDDFIEVVLSMTKRNKDHQGKVLFRLKEEDAILSMYDPYYIVQEKPQSMQQSSYESFYNKKKALNNIVGDYSGNYKYQTQVNKTVKSVFASSQFFRDLILRILNFSILSVKKQANPSEQISDDICNLFSKQTLNASLKLFIMILQNIQNENVAGYVDLVKQLNVVQSLLDISKGDDKFTNIAEYVKTQIANLQKIVNKQGQDEEMKDDQQSDQMAGQSNQPKDQNSDKVTNEQKKAMVNKKKSDIIARMKKKQNTILTSKNNVPNDQEQKQQYTNIESKNPQVENKNEDESQDQSCIFCWEELNKKTFSQKPFTQLGYCTRSKLLFHATKQTLKSQKESLKNQNLEQIAKGEEEEKKEIDQSKATNALGNINGISDDNLVKRLDLDSSLNSSSHSGAVLTKCSHYFHFDCLQDYLVAEGQKMMMDRYTNELVGVDENQIQCPVCKSLSNTWQPAYQISNIDKEVFEKDKVKILDYYMSFLSMLCKTQAATESETLLVDIQKNPLPFLERIYTVFQHRISTMNIKGYQELFDNQKSDTSLKSELTLSDLSLIISSIRKILESYHSQAAIEEFCTELITKKLDSIFLVNEDKRTKFVFERDFSMLFTNLLFFISLVHGDTNKESLLKSISLTCQSIYKNFQVQVLISHLYTKKNGKIIATEDDIKTLFSHKSLFDLASNDFDKEAIIQMQLSFLRKMAAVVLAIRGAFVVDDGQDQGADKNIINTLANQIDDQSEYQHLRQFLNVDTHFDKCFEAVQVQNSSKRVNDVDEEVKEQSAFAQEQDTELPDIIHIVLSMISDEGCLNAKLEEYISNTLIKSLEKKSDDKLELHMPDNMKLLTPYFCFNLIPLPKDFQTLVKEFYSKQCKHCRKQLQQNAICLLCGDIVCFMPKDKCCSNLPGMKQVRMSTNFMHSTVMSEGELSYHARTCEGGHSIFLITGDSSFVLIDDGKIAHIPSCYKNQFGETHNSQSKRWENFYLDEQFGGQRAYDNLKKMYTSHKISNTILGERTKKNKVIRRYIY